MLKPAAIVPAVLTCLLAGSSLLLAITAQPAVAPPKPASTAPSAAPAAPAPDRPAGIRRFGLEKPIAKPAGTVRLATYNIENFFSKAGEFLDTVGAQPVGGDGEDRATQPIKPRAEAQAVADTIRKLDADVIALQEVGSKEDLLAFRDQFLKGLGYDHVSSIDAGDGRGIEQSVLSRFPISNEANWPKKTLEGQHPDRWGRDANEHAGKPIAFARSPLRVTIDLPAAAGKTTPLTLFVVHHKSGGPGGYWREAEAQGVVTIAAEFAKDHPGQPAAILGDFNCRPGDRPISIYQDAGWTDTFEDRNEQDPRWITHTSGRPIDYILANDALKAAVVKDTRFILGTPTRAEGVDWRNTPNPAGWASDHYPVVIDLKFGK